MKVITEYQKIFSQRYSDKYDKNNVQRQGDYEYMFLAPEQYGVEEDIIDFMNKHPHASFEELLTFVDTVIPDIEIVPDDELEED